VAQTVPLAGNLRGVAQLEKLLLQITSTLAAVIGQNFVRLLPERFKPCG